MSKCQELEPLLAPYADGEAHGADRAAVEAHLDRCPGCRDRVVSQSVARDVIAARRDRLRPCASSDLHARCAAQRLARAGLRIGRSRTWVPLSLAATLVLAVAGALVFGLGTNVQAVAAQLALDHARCFQIAPERLAHGEAAVAERDWAAWQGWTLRVPPSAPSHQLELLGVRRCLTTSGTNAHLLYRWRGAPLSVFVLPRTLNTRAQIARRVNTFGHETVIWAEGDRTYVAVAHGHPADFPAVVGYMKAALDQ